jgi:hypothetical protein
MSPLARIQKPGKDHGPALACPKTYSSARDLAMKKLPFSFIINPNQN